MPETRIQTRSLTDQKSGIVDSDALQLSKRVFALPLLIPSTRSFETLLKQVQGYLALQGYLAHHRGILLKRNSGALQGYPAHQKLLNPRGPP